MGQMLGLRSCCEPRDNGKPRKGVWLGKDGEVIRSVYDVLREGLDPRQPLEARKPLPEAVAEDGDRGRLGFWEDGVATCFVPRDPSAALHLLVVPREHVRNTGVLGPGHLPLLEHLRTVGEEQLRLCCARLGLPPEEASFVFHVPPHNSIDHLHLHCILPPYDSLWKRLKYRPGTFWCKSYEEVHAALAAVTGRSASAPLSASKL